VLDAGVKIAARALLLVGVIAAGCGGGGGDGKQASAPASAPSPTPAATAPSQQPTATTGEPPKRHRTAPNRTAGGRSSESAPLKVSARYSCKGRPLRGLRAAGPVRVRPAVVRPGQSFTVTVTDPGVKVAVVTLTGVAQEPIQVSGREQNGHVAATLKMPGYASCGNKLLEVEGDLSAEAYVGVAR
jgi:hypothetical protein